MRLSKPWLECTEALAVLKGNLGVFQLGDADGEVLYIGFAGGRSTFGLKGVVSEALANHPRATKVRYEITTAYHTRYRELLMLHVADFGERPVGNSSEDQRAKVAITLGHLSPS